MTGLKTLQIGIDVGSTTVKAVVLDNNAKILWKNYKRHNARQAELVLEFLNSIESDFPDTGFETFITGSGGRVIAPQINARYIQEVNAVTYAVEKIHPNAGSVIELGGQDAKVIIWKQDDQGRKSTLTFMNDKCAGGTGATIDKIFGKIGLPIEDAATISAEGKTIHHIAAKCGVFAETDVVGLVKAGIDREEIFVSLCTAIVKQNLEVLVRGNILRDKVILLGGPHTYLKAFTDLWRLHIPQTWELHGWKPADLPVEQLIFVPDDAQFFAAIGAVLFGRESDQLFFATHKNETAISHKYPGSDKLKNFIQCGRSAQLMSHGTVREGLAKSEEELQEFKSRYTIAPFVPPVLEPGSKIKGYIGIDGGSTSSKLVILDESGTLIYKDYSLSKGNPIIDIREMFQRIENWISSQGIQFEVGGASATGYAASILSEAFCLDLTVVETVAHMKSAVAYYGNVDIICDIGGQDIKVLFMKHNRVVDFNLNTQCSAGNGYFLQNMAEQFGIPIEQYADHAFNAQKAPAFNYGCAVFMEQDKVHFQQLGFTKEEIMAGLALVLPLNIWNYVVQETNIARLGRRILLQGGTQKNLAAVKAQVDFIKSRVPDAEINVHKYADISGAIGAALEVRERQHEQTSRFIGINEAARLVFESYNDESTRCRFCSNRCPRTFIDIHISRDKTVRYISGYGCEKGMVDNIDEMRSQQAQKAATKERFPNHVNLSSKIVFDNYDFDPFPEQGKSVEWPKYLRADKKNDPYTFTKSFKRSSQNAAELRSKMVIGIPKLLNLYFYAPFFNAYLRTLGVKEVVYSDYTSTQLWNEGNKWGAIDPCFPAKVAPAHIYNLLNKSNITHICFPIITHLQSLVENTLGNNACVIQMGTPEVTHAVFTKDRDFFSEKNITYLKPFVRMDRPRETTGQLFEYFKDILQITEDENTWAVTQGFSAQEKYLKQMQEEGIKTLNWLVENDKIGILVLGHPYHHDPGLNHGILDEFQMRGFPVLCIESLPTDPAYLSTLFSEDERKDIYNIKDVWVRNFNRNTNLKIWASKFAARHPNLAVVDLSSFKCGHDAPTYSYVSNIFDASETPHFLFHDIDQNKPRAAFSIRIQTIEYFLRLEEMRLKSRVKELNK
ncbi:MAG: CoA activase [Fibrobacter sp.]|nr:CoA activase [Fibrobacter sp.]